jgi:A-kinase anchor protein 1
MIAKRPIYYTIVPSLVILIGYIWYRRKRNDRANCDKGSDSIEQQNIKNKNCKLLDEAKLGDRQDLISNGNHPYSSVNQFSQQQASLPVTVIGTPQQIQKKKLGLTSTPEKVEGNSREVNRQQSQSPGSAGSSSSSLSSRSAPIDIAPNPRSPPKRITEQEIDCEILKLKPQESDIKNLRYIEDPDSLDDTPLSVDSPPYRSRFEINRTQQPVVEPIVIKGTMEAKISPENSFRERKYTQTESDDSGRLNESESDKINKEEENNMVKVHVNDETSNNSNDNGCVLQDDDVEITEANKNSDIAVISNKSSTPTQPQIASPSLSVCSMHSGDSGQGSSPPQSIGAPTITYEFLVANSCVGFIIGNRGKSVARIKEKTGASVIIRKGFYGTKRQKVCSVEGTQSEIDAALKMIRTLVPDKRNFSMNMERIFITPDNKLVPTFNISSLQLQLIEGFNNDVSVSAIVSGGHIFVQQPLHPTYPSLAPLQHRMNHWYSMTAAPELPEVIDNAICAYFIQENWYRVQIVSHNPETKVCVIKYLDFGGYTNVNASDLRQIHADFMTLPFQAIECILSNIRPPNNSIEWSKDSMDTITSFTSGVILQAQVAGYTQDDVPEVLLFVSISKDNVLFINQELCARKLAEWIPNEEQQQV